MLFLSIFLAHILIVSADRCTYNYDVDPCSLTKEPGSIPCTTEKVKCSKNCFPIIECQIEKKDSGSFEMGNRRTKAQIFADILKKSLWGQGPAHSSQYRDHKRAETLVDAMNELNKWFPRAITKEQK